MTRLAPALFALLLASLGAPLAADPPARQPTTPAPPAPVPPAPTPPVPDEPAAALRIVGETTVAPYRIVRLKAVGVPPKAGVIWKVRPLAADAPANAVDWVGRQNVREPEWVAPPGQYRVELSVGSMGADGVMALDYTEVIVTIGQAPQPPPGPPVPPGPAPDALTATFQVAYAADAAAGKGTAAHATQLARIWRAASQTTVADLNLKTSKDLLTTVHTVVQGQVGDNLPGLRRAVANELNAQLKVTETAVLDTALRDACKLQFARVATALEGVK